MARGSNPTCYNGVPCAGTCVEAGSLQQKGNELAQLEDYTGTDLCLSEHLHEVRLHLMLMLMLYALAAFTTPISPEAQAQHMDGLVNS